MSTKYLTHYSWLVLIFVAIASLFSCDKEQVLPAEGNNTAFTLYDYSGGDTLNFTMRIMYSVNTAEDLPFHFSGRGGEGQIGYAELLDFKLKNLEVGSHTIGKDAELIFKRDYMLFGDEVFQANSGTITITRVSAANVVSGTIAVTYKNVLFLNQVGSALSGEFNRVPK